MSKKYLSISHTLSAAVAAGGNFNVAIPSGYAAADFTGSFASTSVMGAQHDDLPVTFGANINVTWPVGKGTTLPVGTDLTIGVELAASLEEGDGLFEAIANQADSDYASTITDNGTPSAVTVADVTGAHDQTILNNNFATVLEAVKQVEAAHNALLAKLKASGLMVAD